MNFAKHPDAQKFETDEELRLMEEARYITSFDKIVGESPHLRRCLQMAEKVASTDVTVLILGETDTGKELVAQAIHDASGRNDSPMVSVNCAALSASLIESELFGHDKGAFTGAYARQRGMFEIADGGTLFLDEIGEFPLDLQSKLLRVLQEGDFERLGGTETIRTDVRVIAATNRSLQRAVAEGNFRADLYYRINSFPIYLPALHERKGDIPLLVQHFVDKHAQRLGREVESIAIDKIHQLSEQLWTGNIRQLEAFIERDLISGAGAVLQLSESLAPDSLIATSTADMIDSPTCEQPNGITSSMSSTRSNGQSREKAVRPHCLAFRQARLDRR